MSKLRDYPHEDQLFYIEKFIEYCNKVCTKFDDEKPQIKAESYLLNQIKFVD